MAINILDLEPNMVSTDFASYSMLVYGEPKIGKTTFVHEMYGKRVLHIMTEKRYKSLEGAMVAPISNWVEFLGLMKQLKNPKAHELYDVISIDTVENLHDYLEKYVAARYKESRVGERNDLWGADWSDLKTMWKDGLAMIEHAGFVPVFVSHSIQQVVQIPKSAILESDAAELTGSSEVVDKKSGIQYLEFQKFVPDMKDKVMGPINKMVDNILFLTTTADTTGQEHRVIHTRESLQWLAGSTFGNMISPLPLSTEAYKKAVENAVNSVDDKFKTEDRQADADVKSEKLDFDALQKEAQTLALAFHKADKMTEVTAIVDEVFGLGEKLTSATKAQVQQLALAADKMKDLAQEEGVVYE